MKKLILASALLLAGCQTTHLAFRPCPDARLPAEAFPDTAEEVAKVPPGDIPDLVRVLLKGRAARDQRLAEDNDQIQACAKAR